MVKDLAEGRTREGHAGELGAPADDGDCEEEPAPEGTVVCSGADGREDECHYLRARGGQGRRCKCRMGWGRTAKLRPLATSTMELTDLVPLPQGRTHCSEVVHVDPRPCAGFHPAEVARFWKSVKE